jgi:hypothetical protein
MCFGGLGVAPANPAVRLEEIQMLFAVPIVGKILAGFAASEASGDVSATLKTGATKIQSAVSGDPADFAQTLDSVDQAAAKRSQHSLFGADKL